MSIIYLWKFAIRPFLGMTAMGYFELGRFVDLLYADIITVLLCVIVVLLWRILRYERLRWRYIKKKG